MSRIYFYRMEDGHHFIIGNIGIAGNGFKKVVIKCVQNIFLGWEVRFLDLKNCFMARLKVLMGVIVKISLGNAI